MEWESDTYNLFVKLRDYLKVNALVGTCSSAKNRSGFKSVNLFETFADTKHTHVCTHPSQRYFCIHKNRTRKSLIVFRVFVFSFSKHRTDTVNVSFNSCRYIDGALWKKNGVVDLLLLKIGCVTVCSVHSILILSTWDYLLHTFWVRRLSGLSTVAYVCAIVLQSHFANNEHHINVHIRVCLACGMAACCGVVHRVCGLKMNMFHRFHLFIHTFFTVMWKALGVGHFRSRLGALMGRIDSVGIHRATT